MHKPENVTILVVDDNVQNLLTVDAILTPEGYHVVTLKSPKESLKYLLEHEVTVAMLDVNMPEINGFELAKILRGREKTRQVPLIFTSGFHIEENDIHMGYDLGAIDYMTLPLNTQILKAKVRVLVSLYNREKELVQKVQKIRELERSQYERSLALLNQQKEKEKWKLENQHRESELKVQRESAALLEQKALELERSNAELNRFSTIVAHDLQEPLRTISVNLELVEEEIGKSLNKNVKESIHHVIDASQRMSALIRDLLKYSQVGSRLVQNRHSTEMSLVVEKAIENVQASVKETGTQITIGDLPQVFCNEAQLVQVIQNLISNAIKFSKEGKPLIRITSESRENEWVVNVMDNGIGIPKGNESRLFGVFQRLNSRKKYPGTGVGLAVCKKIVENHEGKIWYTSEEGKGTTFSFSLPKVPKNRTEVVPKAVPLDGMRVLVVDDDPTIVTLVNRVYQKEGVVVDQSLSGTEIVEKVKSTPYDAIVMDIQMPEIDGFETLAKLRAAGYTIPTVAFTGVDLYEGKEKFLKAGFSDVVSKNDGPLRLLPFLQKCSQIERNTLH